MVQVLPAPNITLNPTATINQTHNTDLQLKEVEEPLNKTEEKQAQGETRIPSNPGFTGTSFLIAGLIFVIILRNKNNRI
jgi:hypothetical protein